MTKRHEEFLVPLRPLGFGFVLVRPSNQMRVTAFHRVRKHHYANALIFPTSSSRFALSTMKRLNAPTSLPFTALA